MLPGFFVRLHVAQAAVHNFGLHAHVQLLKGVGRHRINLELQRGKARVGFHGGHVLRAAFDRAGHRAVQPLGGHDDAPAQIQRQAQAVMLVPKLLRVGQGRVAIIKKNLIAHK